MTSNTFFKSFLKLTSLALPVAGLALYNNNDNNNSNNIFSSQKSSNHSTNSKNIPIDFFEKYIKEHNLVESSLYKEYSKRLEGDSFLEKSILQDIKGLDYFKVYYEKPFYDAWTREIELSPEERKKIEEQAKLYFFFVPNEGVQRQKGVVHSGLIFTLLDNMAGEAALVAVGLESIVTAYLKTEYLKQLEVNKGYVTVLEVEKVENRKIFIKGKIIDQNEELCAKMNSLFIKIQADTLNKVKVYREIITQIEQSKSNQ